MVKRTLGRAFADDPVWLWLIGNHASMPNRTGRIFAELAKYHIQHESVLMTRSGEAVAVWAPPGTHIIPAKETLAATPTILWGLGRRSFVAVPALLKMEHMHPEERHWYLMVLGTDPSHQRQGFGRKLVQPMLDRADDEGVLSVPGIVEGIERPLLPGVRVRGHSHPRPARERTSPLADGAPAPLTAKVKWVRPGPMAMIPDRRPTREVDRSAVRRWTGSCRRVAPRRVPTGRRRSPPGRRGQSG